MKYTHYAKEKKKINDSKAKILEFQGQKKQLMKRLKDELQCSSLKEAKEKLEQMRTDMDEIDNEIKAGEKELKEKYTRDRSIRYRIMRAKMQTQATRPLHHNEEMRDSYSFQELILQLDS